jgi:hypothetical protein
MTNSPKIRFFISKKQDFKIAVNFLNEAPNEKSRVLKWAFFDLHPKLKILKEEKVIYREKIKILTSYIENFYRKHLPAIKRKTERVKKQWKAIEPEFFKLTDQIFKGYPWPKGKYIGYPTIWGLYPRYLENKTFQFPYRHEIKNYPLIVIAHEMLHFIFYEYVYQNFPAYKQKRYAQSLWVSSEVFNSVIQSQPEWTNLFGGQPLYYPEQKSLIKQAQKGYRKHPSLDRFLNAILPKQF